MKNKPITKDIVVLGHGSCDDGAGGMFVFWALFGDRADYVPSYYGEPAPDLTGKEVYIVDFSFPEEEMYRIANQCKTLVWLDHHATAADLIAKIAETTDKSKVTAEFDNNRSGARMAYDYLMNTVKGNEEFKEYLLERERFIDYIQDNDLWLFKMPNSKAFSLGLRSHKMDFKVWENLSSEEVLDKMIEDGKVIESYYMTKVKDVCRQAYEKDVFGHKVMVVNCNGMFASDAGNELAKGKPFSVSWWYNGREKKFIFSLRSDKDGLDVGELAKKVGGGGHKNAAGFQLKPEDVDKLIDIE